MYTREVSISWPILDVVFFQSQMGRCPVREWLKDLPKADRHEIGVNIQEVQYRWPLGMPRVRKLAPHLWEVRSHLADGIGRTLFTVDEGLMVLLHGFIKKSQKTPGNELSTALQRFKMYQGEPS
ncbi:MAG: type II toxin-antitoxin system RelE/ParE family toxin [Planctomycetes bacterium]|nr:type II toxin-antitoxin system RelE/ParE family toxin [Planctomycetota bacterium]